MTMNNEMVFEEEQIRYVQKKVKELEDYRKRMNNLIPELIECWEKLHKQQKEKEENA